MFLQSDLVNGAVVMGVHPSLPMERVSVILGNNLVGDRVWGDVPPPPVVATFPAPLGDTDISQQYPDLCLVHLRVQCINNQPMQN